MPHDQGAPAYVLVEACVTGVWGQRAVRGGLVAHDQGAPAYALVDSVCDRVFRPTSSAWRSGAP